MAQSAALARLAPYAAWLGFSDRGDEGVWTWEPPGCNSTLERWDPGGDEPNGGSYENCAVAWGSSSGREPGTWNDDNCDCFHASRECNDWEDEWEDEWEGWEEDDDDDPRGASAGLIILVVVLVVVIIVIGGGLAYLGGRYRSLEARTRALQSSQPPLEIATVEAIPAGGVELAPCDGGRYTVQAESGDGGRYAGIVQAGSGAGLAPLDGGRCAGIVQAGSGAGLAPLDGGRYAGIVQAEPIKEGAFGGTQTL